MLKLKSLIKFAVIGLTIISGSIAFAADKDMNVDANDVAVHGYDPVAYFTAGEPTHGSSQYTATYKNAIYQFSSAQNRDAFRGNPSKYAPQYGGYCAMGVALTKKLDGDPTAWKIRDGKLYLNLNKDVQAKWVQDIPGNLKTAETIWPKIKEKKASDL